MTKHSPAPWVVTETGTDEPVIVAADEMNVCTIHPIPTADHSAANERLIAAAPDLLKAIKRLALHTQAADIRAGYMESCVELQEAREAIAKAEGKKLEDYRK